MKNKKQNTKGKIQNTKNKKIYWFTLVELIIVITILSILATIAFFYFSWYASKARDSKRVSDLKNIQTAIDLKLVTTWKTPTPDKFVNIKSENDLIWYQWEIWENVVTFLNMSNNLKDPLTWENYFYTTNKSNSKAQTVALLEWENNIWTWNTLKTPIYSWEPVWLILDNNNNPIHKNNTVLTNKEFNTLTWTLVNTDIKVVLWQSTNLYKPFIIWWQLLQLSKSSSFLAPTNCPLNFIPVPWNSDLWQPWFCVGKYEASFETNNESKLLTLPWKDVATKFDTVGELCYWNWAWYWVMTLMQRLTIARNIENVDSNWSWWKVWDWHIKTWNSWDAITWFVKNELLKTWVSWVSLEDELRQLKLSNWEIIWDFIWNAWELVSPFNLMNWENEINKYLDTTSGYSNYLNNYIAKDAVIWDDNYFQELKDENFKVLYWPKNVLEWNIWYWTVKFNWFSHSREILTWGDYDIIPSWKLQNWLYSFFKNNNNINPKITIRCTYNP